MKPLNLSSRSAKSKTLCGIQSSGSSCQEHREDDAVTLSGIVAVGIELARKCAGCAIELNVQVALASGRLPRLERGEDMEVLERLRLQTERRVRLEILGAQEFGLSPPRRPPPIPAPAEPACLARVDRDP